MSDLNTPDVNTSGEAGSTTEPTTSSAPSPFEVREDSLLKFKDGDREETLSWKDLQTQRMLHRDYTQKRQADAEARRAFDTEREAFTKQQEALQAQQRSLAEIFNDDQKFAALVLARQSRMSQQAQGQGQTVTPETLAQYQERVRQDVVAQMQDEMKRFRIEQETTRVEKELDDYSRHVLRDYPLLAAVDGIEEAIYNKVAALKPGSLAEAKEQVRLAIEARNTSLVKAMEEKSKRDAIDKEKATRGIEPKGGQAQLPQGKKYKLNDPDLTKDMTAFFENYFKNQAE